MTMQEMQKQIYQNKIAKGFNLTNVELEFCYIYGELGEAYEAYYKKKDDLGGELADVGIYLMGLAEILGFSLYDEIKKKMDVNAKRVYKFDEKGRPYKEKQGSK